MLPHKTECPYSRDGLYKLTDEELSLLRMYLRGAGWEIVERLLNTEANLAAREWVDEADERKVHQLQGKVLFIDGFLRKLACSIEERGNASRE